MQVIYRLCWNDFYKVENNSNSFTWKYFICTHIKWIFFVHNKYSRIFSKKLYMCNASCNDAHGGMAKHWGCIEYFTVLGENFPHHHLSIKNFGIVCPSLGPYFSSSNWRGGWGASINCVVSTRWHFCGFTLG